MNSKYPEIEQLKSLYDKHRISITVYPEKVLAGKSYYPFVRFDIDTKTFELFVDDEFSDLKLDQPLLHLCLVLRELESYQFAEDYLIWCKERFIDAADQQALENYRQLARVYAEVEAIIGVIDSQVSDLDFELNAGAAQELRKSIG